MQEKSETERQEELTSTRRTIFKAFRTQQEELVKAQHKVESIKAIIADHSKAIEDLSIQQFGVIIEPQILEVLKIISSRPTSDLVNHILRSFLKKHYPQLVETKET